MIKKLLSGIAVLVMVAVIAMNVNVNLQGAKQGSGITLTKAEALATEKKPPFDWDLVSYICSDGEGAIQKCEIIDDGDGCEYTSEVTSCPNPNATGTGWGADSTSLCLRQGGPGHDWQPNNSTSMICSRCGGLKPGGSNDGNSGNSCNSGDCTQGHNWQPYNNVYMKCSQCGALKQLPGGNNGNHSWVSLGYNEYLNTWTWMCNCGCGQIKSTTTPYPPL